MTDAYKIKVIKADTGEVVIEFDPTEPPHDNR